MNSTPTPSAIEPNDALAARADERLVHAYEQIARADEQLARVTEQLSKLEQDAARQPSATLGRRPSRGRPALRGFLGLLLASCIAAAAFVLQSSYGDAAKLMIARWAPQLVLASSEQAEKPGPAGQPGPSPVQLAAAGPATAQAIPAQAAQATPDQATPSAQTPPQDVAPAPAPISPELAQLMQTMARDIANVEQRIEQLKAGQDQLAGDNAKAIEELKAGQDQMTRLITRVAEQGQNLRPKPTVPAPQPVAAPARKPAPVHPSPQARAQP